MKECGTMAWILQSGPLGEELRLLKRNAFKKHTCHVDRGTDIGSLNLMPSYLPSLLLPKARLL